MNARKVAAQFAAYAWYEEVRSGKHPPEEAARFAKEHGQAFLAVAPEGWGRLLIEIATQHPKKGRKHRRLQIVAAAG